MPQDHAPYEYRHNRRRSGPPSRRCWSIRESRDFSRSQKKTGRPSRIGLAPRDLRTGRLTRGPNRRRSHGRTAAVVLGGRWFWARTRRALLGATPSSPMQSRGLDRRMRKSNRRNVAAGAAGIRARGSSDGALRDACLSQGSESARARLRADGMNDPDVDCKCLGSRPAYVLRLLPTPRREWPRARIVEVTDHHICVEKHETLRHWVDERLVDGRLPDEPRRAMGR